MDSDNNPEQRCCQTKLLPIVLSSVITALLITIAVVALIILIPAPKLLSYLGYSDILAVTDPALIKDHHTEHLIGRLVANGTLINLKEYWEFQAGFYETVITLLIFINGLLAAVAVVYIRSSSHEKAERIASEYLTSDVFRVRLDELVNDRSKIELKKARSDIEEFIKKFEQYPDLINENSESYKELKSEHSDLRQQMRVIAERIASMDDEDSGGSALKIT